MINKWLVCFAALLLLPAIFATTHAAQVTIQYQGQARTITRTPFGLTVNIGDPVTGFFTYETTTPDTDSNPQRGTYPHTAGGAFSATILGRTITGTTTPQAQVEDFNPDTFRYNDGGSRGVMSIDGVPDPDITLGISLTRDPGSAVTSDALPDPFPWAPSDAHTFSLGDDQGGILIQFDVITTVVPQPPVAVDDAFSVQQDSTLTVNPPGVLVNDSDPDGDPITAVVDTQPSSGSLTLNADGSFTYMPTTGFTGTDTFTYTASDGGLSSNVATVTITVTPANAAPVAVDDAYSVQEGQTLNIAAPGVLGNDSDAESDPLTAVIGTGPANGVLLLNADGSFTYTPSSGFSGTDSFTYTANDAQPSGAATVTITVTPAPPPPDCIEMLSSIADGYEVFVQTTLATELPAIAALLASGDRTGAITLQQATIATLVQEAGNTVAAIQTECASCEAELIAAGQEHRVANLMNACIAQTHRVGALQAAAVAQLENLIGTPPPPRTTLAMRKQYLKVIEQNRAQTLAALDAFEARYAPVIAGHAAGGDTAMADATVAMAREVVSRSAAARVARIQQLCENFAARAGRYNGTHNLIAEVVRAANEAMLDIQLAEADTLAAIDTAAGT